jgi:hypothetical protein
MLSGEDYILTGLCIRSWISNLNKIQNPRPSMKFLGARPIQWDLLILVQYKIKYKPSLSPIWWRMYRRAPVLLIGFHFSSRSIPMPSKDCDSPGHPIVPAMPMRLDVTCTADDMIWALWQKQRQKVLLGFWSQFWKRAETRFTLLRNAASSSAQCPTTGGATGHSANCLRINQWVEVAYFTCLNLLEFRPLL